MTFRTVLTLLVALILSLGFIHLFLTLPLLDAHMRATSQFQAAITYDLSRKDQDLPLGSYL